MLDLPCRLVSEKNKIYNNKYSTVIKNNNFANGHNIMFGSTIQMS